MRIRDMDLIREEIPDLALHNTYAPFAVTSPYPTVAYYSPLFGNDGEIIMVRSRYRRTPHSSLHINPFHPRGNTIAWIARQQLVHGIALPKLSNLRVQWMDCPSSGQTVRGNLLGHESQVQRPRARLNLSEISLGVGSYRG